MLLRCSVLAPVLLVAVACDGCGDADPVAPPDSGADAGHDGGPDAGSDGGPDAARDATAALDGGLLAEAGWVPLEGLPEGCVVERASHPERVFAPRWVPCEGAVPGCEMLAHDELFERAVQEAGAHDGAAGYFSFFHYPAVEQPFVLVLATTDGPPIGAWRMPSLTEEGACRAAIPGLSSEVAAIVVGAFRDDWGSREQIYHAPLSEIGVAASPVAVLDETNALFGANFTQSIAVSATTVAGEVQPGGFVVIVEDGAVRVVGPAPGVRGIPQNVQVVGSHVLWEDWSARVTVADATISRGAEPFFVAPGADVVSFRTDGRDMAWYQGYDRVGSGPYARVELWTSPYAARPEDLRPRKVRDVDAPVRGLTGGGHFARVYTDVEGGHLQVYDLAAGRRRSVVLRPGVAMNSVLYATDSELLVHVSDHGLQTVMRFEIAAIPYDE